MYARLKGVRPEFVDKEVERTLKDIGLESKARSYPTQLSGGQKRKLSLGIAFIGQSKIVFLDEPTSGKLEWMVFIYYLCILNIKKHETYRNGSSSKTCNMGIDCQRKAKSYDNFNKLSEK